MKLERKCVRGVLVAGILAVTAVAQGVSTTNVENMQINMAAVNYYNGTVAKPYFQIQQAVSLNDVVSVANLPVSTNLGTNTHEIDGTFTMTRTELKQDQSSGATIGARGLFDGGEIINGSLVRSTFQLTGKLYSVQRDGQGNKIGETLISSGLLLEAEMTIDEFLLKEEQLPNRVVSGDTSGLQVFYRPVSGSMVDGSSGLTIGDFRADFFMTNSSVVFTNGPITNFSNQKYQVFGPVSIQIEAIPEPMTFALLGLGSLFLSKRRKHSNQNK